MSTPESKDLRDLAEKISELARNHSAFSMVHRPVQNCCDHICAMARNLELEKEHHHE
jgi:hypothetical protein